MAAEECRVSHPACSLGRTQRSLGLKPLNPNVFRRVKLPEGEAPVRSEVGNVLGFGLRIERLKAGLEEAQVFGLVGHTQASDIVAVREN